MNRQDVIATLRAHGAELRRQGVARAPVFGSVARDEAKPDSDLDILVEIDPTANLDVYAYVGVAQYLAELFPIRFDVANRAQLKPHVRPSAEREAVYAF